MNQEQAQRKRVALVSAACALLCTSVLALAQTQLKVENDGLTLSAFASSSKDVLSTTLRVIGPDGFVYEERIEDDAIRWVPEGDLPDGLYRWEARTVTLEPGAPARDISAPAQRTSSIPQTGQQVTDEIPKSVNSKKKLEIPVERYFDDGYKNVTTESGVFRVQDGWMAPIVDPDNDLSHIPEPGLLERFAGAVIDFAFPSAHAEECLSPCDVNSTTNVSELTINADTEGSPFGIEIEISSSSGFVDFDEEGSEAAPVKFDLIGAPENSLTVDSTGNVGQGTASPTQDFHIADLAPEIRLEDTNDATSWYVKNSNAGRFEIGDASGSDNAFTIESGAPYASVYVNSSGNFGIGTSTPAEDLHIFNTNGPQIRLEQENLFSGLTDTADLFVGNVGLWFQDTESEAIVKFNHAAAQDSLVVSGNGVGIGTSSPSVNLEIQDSARSAVKIAAGTDQQADFTLSTGGTNRWVFRARSSTNNFEIARRDTNGGFLDVPFLIPYATGVTQIRNGINFIDGSTPSAPGTGATLYVDNSDGDLKVRFANGTIKVLATN
jgi:hypothetical protein